MATHLCNIPKGYNWEQIKRYIFGRQRGADNYICGGCSRTFETVCCLHVHCMKHNGGGSYYFDHVTNTAFPKFDTRCSASQWDAEDLKVTHGQAILTGNTVSVSRTEETELLGHLEETDRAETDITVSSDTDSIKQIDNISSLGTDYKEITTDAGVFNKDEAEESEKAESGREKGVTAVKVRNIKRKEDGSITCEMNENDAHLFEVTASTIVHQLREIGEAFLENFEELEVLVPKGSPPDTKIAAGQSSTNDIIQTTGESNREEESHSIVVKTLSRTTQKTDCEEHRSKIRIGIVPEAGTESPQHKRSRDLSSPLEDTIISSPERKYSVLHDTGEEIEKCTGSESGEGGKDDIEEEVDKTNAVVQNVTSKKHEIIENLNLTPTNEVHGNKPGKRDRRSSKTDMEKGIRQNNKQNENVVQFPIRTRPERKRKLTTKMKESELPDTLKLIKREPCFKNEDENDSIKYKRSIRKGKTDGIKHKRGDRHISDKLKYDVDTGGIKSKRTSKKPNASEGSLCDSISEFVSSSIEQEQENISKEKTLGLKSEKSEFEDNDDAELCKVRNDKTDKSAVGMKKTVAQHDFAEHAESGKEKNEMNLMENVIVKQEMSEDNAETDSVQEDNKDKVKKSLNNFRKKQRSKKLEAGKIPIYKRNDFKCQVCGKVGSMNMIKYHQQMHSNKMPYKCEECGKCFKTAGCKRGHVRQHGEKKWKCDQCPAAFFRKQYLEMHMTKHTGELPFMCELCGMKFRMAYIVRRHIDSVHKDIRNYKCNICEKTFFRASTRNEHQKRHLEAYLECSYCPKKFKADLDLRKHELTHSGEKQFFCPLCNQGFTQIWPYYRHMWKIHNIRKDEAKNMRIKNPDIVNMRYINKGVVKKEPGYVHEFIGKPGCTFDMRKSFSQNVKKNSMKENGIGSYDRTFMFTKGAGVSTVTRQECETNAAYTETSSEMTDTIVLDIAEDFNTNETIVIHTEDLQNADNQGPGYIVVEDGNGAENILIYSEFPQNDIEDAREYTSVDSTGL